MPIVVYRMDIIDFFAEMILITPNDGKESDLLKLMKACSFYSNKHL
jgi:hypothetical protein